MGMSTTRIHRPSLFVATLLTTALVMGGCARESDENTNEGVNPGAGAIVAEVQLTDEGIQMPDALPAGAVLFEVTNSGTAPHGFAIEGVEPSLDSLFSDVLEELRVDLEPGTYRVYSPVDGDADAGLERELTVTEPEDGS